MSSIAWDNLTFRQKETRLRALEALSLMRKGKSMTAATKDTGIIPVTFKRHVGKPLDRKKGRWRAKNHDRISRVMTIFSNGKRYNIETKSSATASIIGRYNSAVGHFTQ
ncbi:MAG: helix-turn-helix transcriptional regulator, partial [Nitrososphaera sp.]